DVPLDTDPASHSPVHWTGPGRYRENPLRPALLPSVPAGGASLPSPGGRPQILLLSIRRGAALQESPNREAAAEGGSAVLPAPGRSPSRHTRKKEHRDRVPSPTPPVPPGEAPVATPGFSLSASRPRRNSLRPTRRRRGFFYRS